MEAVRAAIEAEQDAARATKAHSMQLKKAMEDTEAVSVNYSFSYFPPTSRYNTVRSLSGKQVTHKWTLTYDSPMIFCLNFDMIMNPDDLPTLINALSDTLK